MKTLNTIFLSLLVCSVLWSCGNSSEGESSTNGSNASTSNSGSLGSPFETGELVVLVNNSVTSFFIYRGEPMGFEYEMLKEVCKAYNLELKIKMITDVDHILDSLQAGKGHLAAANLTISSDRMEKVDFTKPVFTTHQVLVQRKPDNWRKMNPYTISKVLVRDPLELENDTVTVRRNSSYYQRLVNFVTETNADIVIDTVPGNMETELLMEAVNEGRINYTMADDNIAAIYSTYFDYVDIETQMSLSQPIGWAVNKENNTIKDSLDKWINENKGGMKYNWTYKKYFEIEKGENRIAKEEIQEFKDNQISPYDDLIKKNAEKLGWDWRFLAAQVRKESRFNPKTVSWVGAKGLLQLMPTTAERFGVVDLFDPAQNLKGGVKFIQWLDNYWDDHVADSAERVKFILASYNAGQGHVMDAVRLAKKYKLNPKVWDDNVEEMLRNKSQKEYHEDPVVKYGYCRGAEPVKYVSEIYTIYDLYKSFDDGKTSQELSIR